MIIAGGGPITLSEQNLINNLGIRKELLLILMLVTLFIKLYSEATVFVFPSLYEGFGIPVLEAMQCGCPVVLSDNSSLPEVGGRAASYFDPFKLLHV
ncbi:MAG: glycosyltransferase [Chitinophagaceae bacterium]|nr:glycosyltransferase [Chitinophagaceae bacterium]